MSKKVIVLISEGRSGTNGLYRHIFANKKQKPEPYKGTKTKSKPHFKKSLKANMQEFEDKVIVHIKPQHTYSDGTYKKLTIPDLIDTCMECGIHNFIVITRLNILAKISSSVECYLNLTTVEKVKHKSKISIEKLKDKLKKGYSFENDTIQYINSKEGANLVTLVYEEDIKNDINIACKKVVDKFDFLPNNYEKYSEDLATQKHLSPFERNNNIFDKRPQHKRIINLEATQKALAKYDAEWMLEYNTEKNE